MNQILVKKQKGSFIVRKSEENNGTAERKYIVSVMGLRDTVVTHHIIETINEVYQLGHLKNTSKKGLIDDYVKSRARIVRLKNQKK